MTLTEAGTTSKEHYIIVGSLEADPMNGNEQVKTYPFWIGEPDDVAHIALFLSSHESRMITGAAIAADGGRSAY